MKNRICLNFSEREIDPADIMIIRDQVKDKMVKVYNADSNGDPHNRVDVVILGEGYNLDEKAKFEKDLKYFTDVFFGLEPYKSMRINLIFMEFTSLLKIAALMNHQRINIQIQYLTAHLIRWVLRDIF